MIKMPMVPSTANSRTVAARIERDARFASGLEPHDFLPDKEAYQAQFNKLYNFRIRDVSYVLNEIYCKY